MSKHEQYPSAGVILETVIGWLLTTNSRIHALSITYSVKLHQSINQQYHQQYEILPTLALVDCKT